MELTCIGTGGGRYCMSTQVRYTGGFMLSHAETQLYVDPGPGALVRGIEHGIDFGSVDGLFVSHAHLDHYGDTEALIEAMTKGCKDDRGTLITNGTVLEGHHDTSGVISSYHRDSIGRVETIAAGDTCDLASWTMQVTGTDHKDIETTGFCLEIGDTTIGYLPDTSYTDELLDQYAGIDYLIANVLRPVDKEWEGHLNLAEATELAEELAPEKAFFQHFGMNFVTSFREQLSWLEDHDPDIPITLASDMTTYTFEKQGLERFV